MPEIGAQSAVTRSFSRRICIVSVTRFHVARDVRIGARIVPIERVGETKPTASRGTSDCFRYRCARIQRDSRIVCACVRAPVASQHAYVRDVDQCANASSPPASVVSPTPYASVSERCLRAQREPRAGARRRRRPRARTRASATSRCGRATRARSCPEPRGTSRARATCRARGESGMPSTLMNSGASRKPPLLPSSPETNPTTPTTTRMRARSSVARRRRVGRRDRVVVRRVEQDAQPEREHDDVGDDDERTAGNPAREQRADDRRRQSDRQAEAHDAAVDVAGARVRATREPASTGSSPGAATRSRRSRERRAGAAAASRSRSRPCRTRRTGSRHRRRSASRRASTCVVTPPFNGRTSHRSSLL